MSTRGLRLLRPPELRELPRYLLDQADAILRFARVERASRTPLVVEQLRRIGVTPKGFRSSTGSRKEER